MGATSIGLKEEEEVDAKGKAVGPEVAQVSMMAAAVARPSSSCWAMDRDSHHMYYCSK
jgi:hypothetical protein